MKVRNIILNLLLCFIVITGVFVDTIVHALNSNVLEGYNQIVNVGGTNSSSSDGVSVSKTINETDIENYFDITLKVTTNSKVEEILRDQDLAVVIVMDVSNTMIQYNIDGTKNKFGNNNGDGTYNPDYVYGKANDNTRYATALTAGSNLINEFASYSNKVSSETKRQIGYVAFNSNAKKIFGLTECKTTASATTLINTMKNETKKIMETKRYNSAYDRFTNIEAGLKMAKDMLNGIKADNKYIIFLSDGLPTTYIKSGYTGYNNYNQNDASPSKTGVFYNDILKIPCHYGVDYSNLAAIKARQMATSIKNNDITIYTVGVGIENQTTVKDMILNEKKNPGNYENEEGKFSLVDINTTIDKIEVGQTKTDFKNWLKNSIGSNYYYSAEDKQSLEKAYTEIFKVIKSSVESSSSATWVSEDPMSASTEVSNIEFVGLYDDINNLHDALDYTKENQSDTASFANNKITWDLKKSNCTTITSGNKTYYVYEIKYRIRLKNEDNNFDITKIYETNGPTTLTYVVRKDGVLQKQKTINFPIPQVVGYLGSLSFTKKSSFDSITLPNATFKLSHDESCPCHKERKYPTINDIEATSNSNGLVTFSNIPSGHKYILSEVKAPSNHVLSTKTYNITVSYGTVTGLPSNNEIFNDIKTTNLKITKLVKGEMKQSLSFKFKIEIFLNNNKLTGTYKYKVNNKTYDLDLTTGLFDLKKGEELIIYDLPVGATYKIEELTTEGFTVTNEINSTITNEGSIALCNNSSCSLKENGNNTVTYLNTLNYLLPETGSSKMLVLYIISSLLITISSLYLVINKRKENN